VTVLRMADGVGVYPGLRAERDSLQRLIGGNGGNGRDSRGGRPRWAGPPPARGLLGLANRIRYAILWGKPLRRMLYPLGLLIFLAIRFYVATVRGRVRVTCCFFFDTLAA